MLAFGIGALIGLQATINIAVATVSVPTKGLSLPLVSAGGSGLVITCAALGLLYSIARSEHSPEELDEPVESVVDQTAARVAARGAASEMKLDERPPETVGPQISTSAMSATAIWDVNA
jgi:cell division protein FtsW